MTRPDPPIVECEKQHASLYVPDVPAAVDFYTKKLGFKLAFTWGEPPVMAGVNLGNEQMFLERGTPAPEGCSVYFVVGDADELHDYQAAQGAEVIQPLADRPYGLRDYMVRDLNGYRLGFGHHLMGSAPPLEVERVDVLVRMEKRLAAMLADLAEHKRMSVGSCLEETLLHTFEDVGPHTKSQLRKIRELKERHGIDYDSHASYRFVERSGGSHLPFLDAVKRGDAAAVAAHLAASPELARVTSDHAKSGLHWAAELDREDVARLLLDAGADLEARTSWGDSALEWAATMGSGRVAELLLARGATGLTLIQAAALGKLAEVRSFVESGALLASHARRITTGPPEQWPADSAHLRGDVLGDALYAAARNGHDDVVTWLLDRGAAVDARGFFGATGMMWAAVNGHASTVALLLRRGASRHLRDANFGGDALGWAEQGGHPEVIALLR